MFSSNVSINVGILKYFEIFRNFVSLFKYDSGLQFLYLAGSFLIVILKLIEYIFIGKKILITLSPCLHRNRQDSIPYVTICSDKTRSKVRLN